MENIIFLFIIGIIVFYLYKRNYRTCPKCGKKAIRTGKMVQRGTGRVLRGYKCSCGKFWYDE